MYVSFLLFAQALVHSPNLSHTLRVWAKHLKPGGVVVVVDDFLSNASHRTDNNKPDIDVFSEMYVALILLYVVFRQRLFVCLFVCLKRKHLLRTCVLLRVHQ